MVQPALVDKHPVPVHRQLGLRLLVQLGQRLLVQPVLVDKQPAVVDKQQAVVQQQPTLVLLVEPAVVDTKQEPVPRQQELGAVTQVPYHHGTHIRLPQVHRTVNIVIVFVMLEHIHIHTVVLGYCLNSVGLREDPPTLEKATRKLTVDNIVLSILAVLIVLKPTFTQERQLIQI